MQRIRKLLPIERGENRQWQEFGRSTDLIRRLSNTKSYKYFQRVKETMVKELNEAMKIMFHQIENINKGEKKLCIKKNQMEILELEITVI